MSILDRLFGKKPPAPPPLPVRDVAALVAPLGAPAARVSFGFSPSRSYSGGDPGLPPGVSWPTREDVQLTFLARLSLAEIQAAAPIPWLPETGALLFFYDMENQPWGFDPADRGGWAVLLVDDLEAPAARPAPTTGGGSAPLFRYAKFSAFTSLPSWERPEVQSLGLTDAEFEALDGLQEQAFGEQPKHQIGGFPTPIQGDSMELEAQLASHGLYCGDPSGYDDPRADALRPGAANWRLLLQLDSDDSLGLCWGDLGTLYFWVGADAARSGDFRDVWLVLQCY